MTQITFRINDSVTDWLKTKNQSAGVQAKNELQRYYKLINKIRFDDRFTKDELLLICEVFNGSRFEFEINIKSHLISEIKSAIQWDKLDKKYQIDTKVFFLKLESLEIIEIVALIDKIEQFWFDKTYQFDTQEKLKKVFGGR